jgi:hypothetical protein
LEKEAPTTRATFVIFKNMTETIDQSAKIRQYGHTAADGLFRKALPYVR